MISVEELNRQNYNRLCEMYDLDYFEFDQFAGEEVTSVRTEYGWFNKRTFDEHHMGGRLRFGKDGKHYSYIPKIHLKAQQLTTFAGSSTWTVNDWERMEQEFIEILEGMPAMEFYSNGSLFKTVENLNDTVYEVIGVDRNLKQYGPEPVYTCRAHIVGLKSKPTKVFFERELRPLTDEEMMLWKLSH